MLSNIQSFVQCFWLVWEVLLVEKFIWNVCNQYNIWYVSIVMHLLWFWFHVDFKWVVYIWWCKNAENRWCKQRKSIWTSFVWKSRTKPNDESFTIDRPWWFALFSASLKRCKHKNAEEETLRCFLIYSLADLYTFESQSPDRISMRLDFNSPHCILSYTIHKTFHA